jgi:hypothetical protein
LLQPTAFAVGWTMLALTGLGMGAVQFDRASLGPMSGESPELPAWIVEFREALVDTGKVPARFYENLVEGYRLHRLGQDNPGAVTREMAEAMLKKAQSFVSMAEDFLKGAGGESETQ